MQSGLFTSLMVIAVGFYSNVSQAEAYTPTDMNKVVATWPAPDAKSDEKADLSFIAKLVDQGQYPGQASQKYGRAKALLKPMIEQQGFNPAAWYLWARVLQHQHQFNQAQQTLDRILRDNPGDISSLLLKANIHLVSNQPQMARQTCLQMLGKTDMLTVSACALEAASYQGKLLDSYQQLSNIEQQTPIKEQATHLWVTQILADMAMRLERPQEAAAVLNTEKLQQLPLSYLVQWADVQLALGHQDNVLQQLTQVSQKITTMDDALLLRLSIAEQQSPVQSDNLWKEQFARRVALRELRQDESHAADLARFYIDVTPNQEKARHWARVNWQDAKLPADKNLLERANQMNQDDY